MGLDSPKWRIGKQGCFSVTSVYNLIYDTKENEEKELYGRAQREFGSFYGVVAIMDY